MAVFQCPGFQPAAIGGIWINVRKRIVAKAGGTLQLAIEDAIDDAVKAGQADGKAAMANDTCAGPCTCVKSVNCNIWTFNATWVAGKAGKLVDITVTGFWQGFLWCIDPTANQTGGIGVPGSDHSGDDHGKKDGGDKSSQGKPKKKKKRESGAKEKKK